MKCRCTKALGTKPSERQLNQDEVRYYEWCLSDAALHGDPRAIGDSSIEQTAVGAEAVIQSVRGSASSTRHAIGRLPAKKVRVAIEDCGSGVSQSAAAEQLPSLAARVLSTESSSDLRRRSGVAGNKEDS